jgi:hypothetical protein
MASQALASSSISYVLRNIRSREVRNLHGFLSGLLAMKQHETVAKYIANFI